MLKPSRLLWGVVLVGCAGIGGSTPSNEVRPTGDPSADPPRDPSAPFNAGERIDMGAADGSIRYAANVFAEDVRMPGDFDGDGVDDLLIVGAAASPPDVVPCEDGCPGFSRAFVDIVYGAPRIGESMRTGARISGWHVSGLRYRVRPAGDVDGDGRNDVLFGVLTEGCEQGNAFVVYGGRLAGEVDVREHGALIRERGSCSHFGMVGALGDVDGDGFDDFAVGAPDAEGGGRAWIYYGGRERRFERRSEADAAASIRGPVGFGYAEPAGDVNGDGRADFIVQTDDPSGRGGGAADRRGWLVLGRADRFVGELAIETVGVPLGFAAHSFAALGDVDADGFDDFAITHADSSQGEGLVVRGRADWSSAIEASDAVAVFRVSSGVRATDRPRVVASAGDVDGDGHRDLLFGDPNYAPEGVSRGAVYLFRGSATGFERELTVDRATAFLGQDWFAADEPTVRRGSDEAGRSIAGGTDLDGDGLDDLALAAPRAPDGGHLYVWLGRRSP